MCVWLGENVVSFLHSFYFWQSLPVPPVNDKPLICYGKCLRMTVPLLKHHVLQCTQSQALERMLYLWHTSPANNFDVGETMSTCATPWLLEFKLKKFCVEIDGNISSHVCKLVSSISSCTLCTDSAYSPMRILTSHHHGDGELDQCMSAMVVRI